MHVAANDSTLRAERVKMTTSPRTRGSVLRDLLEAPELGILPGGFDALSIRLIQQAGFPAAYLSGSMSASIYPGVPDFGIRTSTEYLSQLDGIVNGLEIPLLIDGETGFGSTLAIRRLVRDLERIGVAGMHLEDQGYPRRCTEFEGKVLASIQEHSERICAAVEARRHPDFLILARVEAISIAGIDEALKRAAAYLDAGADMVYFEGVESEEQLQAIPALVDGPVITFQSPVIRTPYSTPSELQAMGYRLAVYPAAVYFPMLEAMRDALDHFATMGLPKSWTWPTLDEWQVLTGVPDALDFERRVALRSSPERSDNV